MAQITPLPNGPYKVEGCRLLDADGNLIKEGEMHLCRCGGSSNKPFCDGTHAKAAFED